MSWQEVGNGNILDAGTISDYVARMPDGSQVLLEIDLRASPAAWMVDQIRQKLEPYGVSVDSGSPVLLFQWNKESSEVSRIAIDPITLITVIIVALAVIAVAVIGWRIFQSVPEPLKGPLATFLIVGGLAAVALIAISYARRSFR